MDSFSPEVNVVPLRVRDSFYSFPLKRSSDSNSGLRLGICTLDDHGHSDLLTRNTIIDSDIILREIQDDINATHLCP